MRFVALIYLIWKTVRKVAIRKKKEESSLESLLFLDGCEK